MCLVKFVRCILVGRPAVSNRPAPIILWLEREHPPKCSTTSKAGELAGKQMFVSVLMINRALTD